MTLKDTKVTNKKVIEKTTTSIVYESNLLAIIWFITLFIWVIIGIWTFDIINIFSYETTHNYIWALKFEMFFLFSGIIVMWIVFFITGLTHSNIIKKNYWTPIILMLVWLYLFWSMEIISISRVWSLDQDLLIKYKVQYVDNNSKGKFTSVNNMLEERKEICYFTQVLNNETWDIVEHDLNYCIIKDNFSKETIDTANKLKDNLLDSLNSKRYKVDFILLNDQNKEVCNHQVNDLWLLWWTFYKFWKLNYEGLTESPSYINPDWIIYNQFDIFNIDSCNIKKVWINGNKYSILIKWMGKNSSDLWFILSEETINKWFIKLKSLPITDDEIEYLIEDN